MLTESFVASTSTSSLEKSNTSKDIGIYHYDFQPLPTLKSTFKKSSTKPNCLAISTSHVFAAQAEKSVIHVYDREKATQEAVVPFPERIRSIALSGDVDGAPTLILGTEGGRVILWELCSGRLVSTPQSHLQPTTCLAVDSTSNFLLSGSPDSNIHLWSIPTLLSFLTSTNNDPSQPLPFSPLRSLSNHRAPINSLVFGHSTSTTNFAVSASADNTCIVWDYIKGSVLHTFLLPSAPLCLALDPADRAVHAGYEDGSIQLINFYPQHSINHPLYDPALQSTPTQPPATDRWSYPSEKTSASLCIQLSYDGTSLISGHQNGMIQTWDIAKGRPRAEIADLASPVTNLTMLAPTGYPNPKPPPLKLNKVVKPRYYDDFSLTGDTNLPSSASMIPEKYTFTTQFTSTIPLPSSSTPSPFHQALSSPTFPPSLLAASISALASNPSPSSQNPPSPSPDNPPTDLAAQNALLLSQLNTALENQRSAIKEMLKMDRERYERLEDERIKKGRKRERRMRRAEREEARRRMIMGEVVEDQGSAGEVQVQETNGLNGVQADEEETLSSSTDELDESE